MLDGLLYLIVLGTGDTLSTGLPITGAGAGERAEGDDFGCATSCGDLDLVNGDVKIRIIELRISTGVSMYGAGLSPTECPERDRLKLRSTLAMGVMTGSSMSASARSMGIAGPSVPCIILALDGGGGGGGGGGYPPIPIILASSSSPSSSPRRLVVLEVDGMAAAGPISDSVIGAIVSTIVVSMLVLVLEICGTIGMVCIIGEAGFSEDNGPLAVGALGGLDIGYGNRFPLGVPVLSILALW